VGQPAWNSLRSWGGKSVRVLLNNHWFIQGVPVPTQSGHRPMCSRETRALFASFFIATLGGRRCNSSGTSRIAEVRDGVLFGKAAVTGSSVPEPRGPGESYHEQLIRETGQTTSLRIATPAAAGKCRGASTHRRMVFITCQASFGLFLLPGDLPPALQRSHPRAVGRRCGLPHPVALYA
jgi:hypothetical protein